MTENRTLAEFGGADADDAQASDEVTDSSVESDDATDSSGPAEAQSAEVTDPEATSEAATVTYAWSSEGDACDVCGETVDRRWRAGEGAADPDSLVCDGCKEW